MKTRERARTILSVFDYLRNQLSVKSRMAEYGSLLRACANEGYRAFTFEDLVAHLCANTPFPARMIVLRHDVDWGVEAARVMFETERRARVRSSYFFRLSTAEERLMNTMAEAGYEVGYHYEEIATFAKRYGLASIEQVGKAMPCIRDAFCENLGKLRRLTGLPIKVVASHGEFVNGMIGMNNYMLLSPAVRRDMGIIAEAYDAAIMKPISYRCIDALPPTLWRSYSPYSGDPRDGVAQHSPYIYAVIHPNNWHPQLPTTARYLLTRASEGVLYWAMKSWRGEFPGHLTETSSYLSMPKRKVDHELRN